jgi:alpha-mannosidase
MTTIYLVPHTHFDAAWIFTTEEYLKINEIIIESALKIMEGSDFKFCLEQTYLLEAIEKRNPDLWSRIAARIKEGRIEIIDGQYLMPDTMLPSGETLVREILMGKRYCQEKFGIDVPVAWAADSFGMNAQLPQIYKKSGYKWLAFRRGARADIRESEFQWKALDGTTILTHWFPLGYRAGLEIPGWRRAFLELNKYASTQHILMPCGSGSMPPQPEIPEAVQEWNQNNTGITMKIATPSEFFQGLESAGKTLEVLEGELYDDDVVDVFPGVCSSRAWILQGARESKNLLITAEAFATIAWLLGDKYPVEGLQEAWKKVLFIAFHDVITGTGVDEIYVELKDIFTNLKIQLTHLRNSALSYISQKVDTGGQATLVFNSLPWRTLNWTKPEQSEGFIAEVPPLGYKTVKSMPPKNRKTEIKVTGNRVETPFWLLRVNEDNGIIEVFDKAGNLLVNGNEINIDDEVGDLYYHRTRFLPELIKSESGEGIFFSSFKPKSFGIEEEGMRVRLVFESEYCGLSWPYRQRDKFPPVIYKYKTIDIHKEVILYQDIPRIDFITKIDNRQPNVRLRVKFDIGMERKVFFRQTQFGVIAEPTEYISHKVVEPCGIPNFLNWFDINNGARGITFMNRGLADMEVIKSSVYITLLRSVLGLAADGVVGPLVPTPDALEFKNYTFEYALQPHDGDWRQAATYKNAGEYTYPPVSITATGEGELPPELSFLRLSPDNLVFSALKKAEDSDAVILRFYETCGEMTEAEVRLFQAIKRVTQVDLLEREEQELPVDGNTCKLEVKPFEIVSLKLEF